MNAAQPGVLIAMKNTSGLCISRTATRLTRLGKTMSDQVARLQAAVRELLKALVEEEENHFHYYAIPGDTFKGSRLEDFGLTKEDMQ